ACDMGPQFHTTDLGRSWSVIPFRQLQSNKWSTVRFTKDRNVCWTLDFSSRKGGEGARPVRSTDGGKTWQALPEDVWPFTRRAGSIDVDFHNPGVIVLSAEGKHIYVSRDAGKSIQRVFSGEPSLYVGGVFFDGKDIYVGTSHNGLIVSRDGGQTFASAG